MSVDVIGKIDHVRLFEELRPFIDNNQRQLMIQGVANESDQYGTGRIANLKHSESEFTNTLHDIPYMNSILKEYGMVRTRLLRLRPGECYTYHMDPTARIHIPIITSVWCLAVIDDIVHRYPADGSVYYVDTTKRHTFINGGDTDRFHIVGVLSGQL